MSLIYTCAVHCPTFLNPELVGGDLMLVPIFCHGRQLGVAEDALTVGVPGVLSARCHMLVWVHLLENIPECCLDLQKVCCCSFNAVMFW